MAVLIEAIHMNPELLNEFITFFVVIDPIGTIPVFIAATCGLSPAHRRHVAYQAIGVSAVILLFFVAFGEAIIRAIGINLSSFELAGGLIIFIFATMMIFGDSKPVEEMKELTASERRQLAVHPLAIPSIAGPGSMLAAVTLTDNEGYSLAQQAITTGTLLCVLLLTLILLLLAGPVNRVIGLSGAAVISRIMGIILAAFAVETVVDALHALQKTF